LYALSEFPQHAQLPHHAKHAGLAAANAHLVEAQSFTGRVKQHRDTELGRRYEQPRPLLFSVDHLHRHGQVGVEVEPGQSNSDPRSLSLRDRLALDREKPTHGSIPTIKLFVLPSL
jgi:hypothetical protein